jgi:hypothetical protein
MNLHQQNDDARRFRRAIERWENEDGQISGKDKEAPVHLKVRRSTKQLRATNELQPRRQQGSAVLVTRSFSPFSTPFPNSF